MGASICGSSRSALSRSRGQSDIMGSAVNEIDDEPLPRHLGTGDMGIGQIDDELSHREVPRLNDRASPERLLVSTTNQAYSKSLRCRIERSASPRDPGLCGAIHRGAGLRSSSGLPPTIGPPIIHPCDRRRFIDSACVDLDGVLKVLVPEQVRERQVVVRVQF